MKRLPGEKNLMLKVGMIAVVVLSLGLASNAFAYTADPMDLSVGARSMGMGKASVGVAEDSETVFSNPAGLGTINTVKLGSMYTDFMGDVTYSVLSGTYPLDNESGTLGVGIIRQESTNIELYSTQGTLESTTGRYGSNILFAAYGFDMSKKLLPMIPNLYGGVTLKYITKSAEGYNTEGLNGSGFSTDLAMLYKPKTFYTLGVTLQDIIAGGMSYPDGTDTIASSIKVGTKIGILGDVMDQNSLYSSDSKLDLAVDYDMGLTYKIPGTAHIGVEYSPALSVSGINNALALRVGLNQIAAPTGTSISNITAGVGFNYQGVEFNYSYSPSYGDLPESSTSFFSISYVGVPTPVKKVEIPVIAQLPMIDSILPGDKITTRSPIVHIEGKLNNPGRVAKVEINGAGVNISENGAFEMNVPVDRTGKHLVTVKAYDVQGNTESRDIRVIRLVKFADVNEDNWAVSPIEKLATAGLVDGYPNGTFQPARALSRAELATLLVKAKGVEAPSVSGKVFKDLPSSHWAAKYVKGALQMGLVTGYPDKTFKPNNKISRTEGVVVLTRFGAISTEAKLIESPYPDITAKNWASPFVAAAKGAGLLDYIGDKDFEPKKELTRAEAMEILSKTSYGKASIDGLMDWNIGFEPMKNTPAVATGVTSNNVSTASSKKGGAVISSVKDFSDVSDDLFASDSIKYLATAGIMNGYSDNTFRPERIVTRAELAAILIKAKNAQIDKNTPSGFADVKKGTWAAPYVQAAVENGYITAKTANKFEPNRGATRAESVAAVVKFDNMNISSDLKKGPFPDMTARDWSSKYVAAAKDAGMLAYLVGQDFESEKSITRAELAEILAKTQYGQAKINQIKAASNYKSEENM